MRNALLGLALLLGGGTAAAFEQTVIPCGVNGNTTSSCTVTASTQMITLSKSTATTSATITSSLAARRVNKVVVPAYKEKYWVAPYQDIGPLAIRDYDGSGMCGKCDPSYNDQYYQTVSIVECSSNARQSTKVCRRYAETWARTAEGRAAPCTITASTNFPAPSAGTYTVTFYGTAPPTYTVYPPTITSTVGRNGKTTYKISKPKTVWYQPQPYNVALTTIVNNGGIVNFFTTINTIISIYLPTTTITATTTVTFTSTVNPTSRTTSTTSARTTTSSRRSTTRPISSTTTQPSVPSTTPQQFYIEALDSATNEYFYVRFLNNQAQLVTDQDAVANGADTFNLTYGFLQNLKTAQGGGFGTGGTFLVGTSGTDGTFPIVQFGGFPSGSALWDLLSLPTNYGSSIPGVVPGYYISGLSLRGAQSFCADAQNNIYSVFSSRSSSCVRTVTFAVVKGVRGAPTTSATTTGQVSTTSTQTATSSTVSVTRTSSGSSTTTTPSEPFYIQAVDTSDGTIRYLRFNGANAYLVSPSEALGGDDTPDDTEPNVDLFEVDDQGRLRAYYGGYIGTPNTNNGAAFRRYSVQPNPPTTFVINPDGSLTVNGASSYCSNSVNALLTNYGGTQAASCRRTFNLFPVSRVTRGTTTTTSSTALATPSSTTAINISGSTTSVSTTSGASTPGSSSSNPVVITTTPISTTVNSAGSTSSTVTTASATPSTFYLRLRSVNGGPSGYAKFRGQDAYLISPTEAYGTATDGSAPQADLFYVLPDGTLRNGLFFVGTSANTTGVRLQRYDTPALGSSKYVMNPDGTMTLVGSTSFCIDSTSEVLVNYNGEVSPQCQYEYLISPVEFVDPDEGATTTGTTTSQTAQSTTSSTISTLTTTAGQTGLTTSSSAATSVATSSVSSSTSSSGISGASTSTSGLSSTTTPVSSLTTASTSSVTTSTPTGTPINQPFYIRAFNPATGSIRYLKFVGDQITLITSSQALSGTTPGNGSPSGADQFTITGVTNPIGNSITGTLFSGPYFVGPSGLTNGATLRRFQNTTVFPFPVPGIFTLTPQGTLTLNGASSFYVDTASDLLVNYLLGASRDCNTFTLSAAFTIADDSASSTSSSLCPVTASATSSTSSTSTSITGPVTTTGITTTGTGASTTSASATSSPTPFYIYAVDPATGQRRYLQRIGTVLVPVDATTGTPDQYLIDALGNLEVTPNDSTIGGNIPGLPYYVSFPTTLTSSPFVATPVRPILPMNFVVSPDNQLTLDNATSYCYTAAGIAILANFRGFTDPTCATPVQLFRAFSLNTSPSTTTSTIGTGLVTTTSLGVTTSGISVPTTSIGVSTSSTSESTTSIGGTTSGVSVSTTSTSTGLTSISTTSVGGTTSGVVVTTPSIGITTSSLTTSALTCPAACITTVTLPPLTTTITVTAGGPTAGTTGTDGYVTVTITSGQTGTTSTSVIASGTTQGTVAVVLPTPAQCGNLGVQFAIQSNPYVRAAQTADPSYAAFMARAFQGERPQATGVTNRIDIPFQSRDSSGSIYGVGVGPGANTLAVNHRAYFFAKMTGNYTFTFPAADEIAMLWLGSDAYGPTYARGNEDLLQVYNGDASTFASQQKQLVVNLNQGSFSALRVLWGNYRDDGQLQFQITAPDGEVLTNGNPSPYLVQYSCDGTTAPMWPQPFGQESTIQRVRGRR